MKKSPARKCTEPMTKKNTKEILRMWSNRSIGYRVQDTGYSFQFPSANFQCKIVLVKLTKDQVQKVAKLARLGLTEAEVEKLQTELSSILTYVGQLSEVNTDEISPTAQVTGLLNVTRDDVAHPNILCEPDALLSCSPLHIEKRHIKVKSVF